MDDGRTIHLSLISHTNVGKTTLARTLLRREVGEVRDQAHVTDRSESHLLIESSAGRLELWDTPGFGDSARLVRRLRGRSNPLGWFLGQVWDRLADRPLWSSQQAASNVQEQADLVLYLVNATEDPEEAGYVRHELELLSWIDRPVLVLLNQLGAVAPGSEEAGRIEDAWRRFTKAWSVVRDVLSLDAFTRCWVEESWLLERVTEALPEESRSTMASLAKAWEERSLGSFRSAILRMAEYLAAVAIQAEVLPGERPSAAERQQAMKSLAEHLDAQTRDLMADLLHEHGLMGESTTRLERSIEDFLVEGTTELTAKKGALLGGVVSGAVGGLAADLLSGGLTFGGGLVAGAILGALGGAGLSRAHELIKLGGTPMVSWSPEFLEELTKQTLLRYLAVAHFGRGRGDFRDQEHPEHWVSAVDRTLTSEAERLRRLWKGLGDRGEEERGRLALDLRKSLQKILVELLSEAYPESRRLLSSLDG